MKIVVLAGGAGAEREVSLSSGSRIARALASSGHSVCVVDSAIGADDPGALRFTDSPDEIPEYSIDEKEPEINVFGSGAEKIGKNIAEICEKGDAVFLALHGGAGENGKIQAFLELNGIKHTGSGCDGCMLSMNKHTAKVLVSAHGIRTPKWSVGRYEPAVGFPCVVKPVNGGSSIGVSVADGFSRLNQALALAKKYDGEIMAEEKIDGREFSVGILDEKALPVVEIIPLSGFYDYKNKYQKGMTKEICPADLPFFLAREMRETALKIHKILRLNYYSRIDFIMNEKNEIYFLEANSLPGMTPTSLLPLEAKAEGISYERLCCMIAENCFQI